MNAKLLRLSLILGTAASLAMYRQAAIPIRQLSAAEATSTEAVYVFGNAIELSDGRVMFNDRTFQNPRLVLFDSKLGAGKTVADSMTLSTGTFRNYGFTAIRFRGDSTVLPDPNGNTLMVLDANGKSGEVMTMPKPVEARAVSGNAGFDAQFRLVYRGTFPRPPSRPSPGGGFSLPAQPDSFPIVRADFESRVTDTLGTVHVALSMNMTATMDQNRMVMKQIRQPLPTMDEWVVLSDGSVAIVRGQDYHIDWIRSDGKKESTPKMPFEWRRATDDDKQHMIDSLKIMDERTRVAVDSINKARGNAPGPSSTMLMETVPLKEIPDYYPPIRAGSVSADRDAHVWILPTTSTQTAGGGLVYDVVNTKGEVFERVQLPAKCGLAGFGAKSRVYVTCAIAGDSTGKAHLQRMTIIH